MKTLKHTLILIFMYTFLAAGSLQAQEGYVPTEGNLEMRQWFQDAKYGLFVHWGVYSILGGGGE